jgi:hypothetical protein
MATQNLSLTSGSASNIDFTKADATALDKVYALFKNSAGNPVLSKETVNFRGGSADEIAIVVDTKYTLKLTANDTANLATGGTYKLYFYNSTTEAHTELFTGSVTVETGETDPAVAEVASGRIFKTKQLPSAEDYRLGDAIYCEDYKQMYFRTEDAAGVAMWRSVTGSNIRLIDESDSLNDYDDTVLVDATGGEITTGLPTAAEKEGKIFTIKKVDSGPNAVIIDPYSDETIDGASTYDLAEGTNSVTIQSDGTNWHVLSNSTL